MADVQSFKERVVNVVSQYAANFCKMPYVFSKEIYDWMKLACEICKQK